MRKTLLVALALCLASSGALACDDHSGTCEIEDWRSWDSFGTLVIEGVATCDTGFIRIRLYDGEGDGQRFLGTADGFIEGHIFSALATNLDTPNNLSIKYSISPDY